MNSLPTRRQTHSLLPDFADLWNSLAPGAGLAQVFGSHLLRVEDVVENDKYVVRAEIPGVDPERDVEVSMQNGQLTIKAERTERQEEKGRSEFSYGSFTRTVTLPQGADSEGVEASYAQGILTVTVPLREPAAAAKKIEVKSGEAKSGEQS